MRILLLILISFSSFGQMRPIVNGWSKSSGPPPTPQTVRFYLEGTGTAAISPAFSGSWTITGSGDRAPMNTTRASTSVFKQGNSFPFTGTGNQSMLLRQFVSSSTVAGNVTITGTMNGQVRSNTNNASSTTIYTTLIVRVISSGGTVRGTLINTLATGAGGTAVTTTTTNRNTPISSALTSVAAQAGDYIVVELGGTQITAPTTGRYINMSFLTSNATDLPVNNTTTTGNNSWIEFQFDNTVF
jgi:hypothetical protein